MLKILIAEDDFISRRFLYKVLSKYGECDLVVDGLEVIDAYMMAKEEKQPYDLICLDIMMPKIDGIKALKAIRDLEMQSDIPNDKRAKIIMTTAVAETDVIKEALNLGCDAYAAKPIDVDKLVEVMKNLELIDSSEE